VELGLGWRERDSVLQKSVLVERLVWKVVKQRRMMDSTDDRVNAVVRACATITAELKGLSEAPLEEQLKETVGDFEQQVQRGEDQW